MSTQKTAGKTGETGEPSIDAGFRSSGLQKGDLGKPGIRGVGASDLSADMAALAPPESDPPSKWPGRPPGTTRGPSKAVQKFLRETLRLLIDKEMDFSVAAKTAEPRYKDAEGTAHTYRQRYPEFYRQVFDELAKAKNVRVAEHILPTLRNLAKKEAGTVAELIDKPGQRTAAKSVRGNPDGYAQLLVEAFANSLATMWAKIEQSDANDSTKDRELILLIHAWKKSCLEVLESGPAGRI